MKKQNRQASVPANGNLESATSCNCERTRMNANESCFAFLATRDRRRFFSRKETQRPQKIGTTKYSNHTNSFFVSGFSPLLLCVLCALAAPHVTKSLKSIGVERRSRKECPPEPWAENQTGEGGKKRNLFRLSMLDQGVVVAWKTRRTPERGWL